MAKQSPNSSLLDFYLQLESVEQPVPDWTTGAEAGNLQPFTEQQQQNLSLRGGFFVGASLDPARRDKKRESDRRYRQKIKDEEKKLGLDFNKLTEDVEWLKIEILPYSEKRQVDEKLKFLEGEVYRRRIELADLQQKLKITRDQREILEKMLPLDEQGTSHSNAHENAPENLEEACRIIKKKQMYLDALLDEKIRKQEKN